MTTSSHGLSANLHQFVAEVIRTRISDGRYHPGDRLVERHIAAELGVSHIPVREALSRLAEEGLVERSQHRGARVATLNGSALEELSALRIVLEQYAITQAQKRVTPEDEAELRALVATMVRAARAGDVQAMMNADADFHLRLWQLANNQILVQVAAALRTRINGFLSAASRALAPKELVRHAHTHDEIVDAVVSGSDRLARAAARKHIEAGAARITASLHIDDGAVPTRPRRIKLDSRA